MRRVGAGCRARADIRPRFASADLGKKTVLVERYATLGGVCLNVGCIPSKALLHVAAVMEEASHFADIGIDFGKPSLDLDKLRAHKSKVVGKLTGGLNTMAKARKVTVLRGIGTFVGSASAAGGHHDAAMDAKAAARKKWCASRRRSSRPARNR